MAATVAIVGASLGGLRAAEQLRAAGWDGPITALGAEPHLPYNRPPLSKDALRRAPAAADSTTAGAELAARTSLPRRPSVGDVTWRLGVPVSAARLDDHVLVLADGTTLEYEGLVVATGLRPRRLPLPGLRGRHVLRTVEDASRLRAALTAGARVIVVGGGFIGCEVAATARGLGCDVTVVEPCRVPMLGPLGEELGRAVQGHHEGHGIRFHLGRTVVALAGDREGSIRSVELDDGASLGCEVLVEAIGSHPNVEWLEGNALDLRDGVRCDEWMRVEGRPEVVAVGDIARFPHPLFDNEARRVEHWCIPTDSARRAAPTLVAHLTRTPLRTPPPAPLPSFWSDQFDLRVRGLGALGLADEHVTLDGRPDALDEGVAVGATRRGRLVGVVTVGLPPAALHRYRERLTHEAAAWGPTARQAA